MKKILRGEEARNALLAGMREVAECVGATLGPQGRNAVIHIGWGQIPLSTRDGVTVAKSIDLPDPVLNAGAQLLKSVSAKTAEIAGDGTTTAAVLAYNFCTEGMKAIREGANPVELSKAILAEANQAAQKLTEMAKPIFGDAVEHVATISANNDPVLGKIIAEAVRMAGAYGIITVEDSNSLETTVHLTEGMRLASGWRTPHFVNDPQKQEFRSDDCRVIVFEKKLGSLKPGLHKLFATLAQQRLPTLFLAEEIEGDVMATMAVNRMQGAIPWCAVRLPQGTSVEMLGDIAAICGTKPITEDLGLPEDEPPMGYIGMAKNVKVTRSETTILGYGRTEEIEARLSSIVTQIEICTDSLERDRLQERLVKLSGGVALIRVGAATEVELREKKARIEDAIHATKAAIAEGVVPGGGMALFYIAGESRFSEVLCAPLCKIAENAGKSETGIIEEILRTRKVMTGEGNAWGWNALTDKFENLLKSGVIDPVKVTRTALLNAASLAAIMLLTETLVIDVEESK